MKGKQVCEVSDIEKGGKYPDCYFTCDWFEGEPFVYPKGVCLEGVDLRDRRGRALLGAHYDYKKSLFSHQSQV